MAKNDNPHALRFISSMEKHNLGEEAIKFSQEHPLSKSADIEKKFEWAQNKRIEKGLPQTWCYCTLGYLYYIVHEVGCRWFFDHYLLYFTPTLFSTLPMHNLDSYPTYISFQKELFI